MENIEYKEFPFYFDIGDYIYYITNDSYGLHPRIMKCMVTGIGIPRTTTRQPVEPTYHVKSVGEDEEDEDYTANIKYRTSKGKIFLSREEALDFIKNPGREPEEMTCKRKISLPLPGQRVLLLVNGRRMQFTISRIRMDCEWKPLMELARNLSEREEKEYHKNPDYSIPYQTLHITEQEFNQGYVSRPKLDKQKNKEHCP